MYRYAVVQVLNPEWVMSHILKDFRLYVWPHESAFPWVMVLIITVNVTQASIIMAPTDSDISIRERQ